jgi:hypothetical protein
MAPVLGSDLRSVTLTVSQMTSLPTSPHTQTLFPRGCCGQVVDSPDPLCHATHGQKGHGVQLLIQLFEYGLWPCD